MTYIYIPQSEFDGYDFTSECTYLIPIARYEGYTTKADSTGIQEPVSMTYVSMMYDGDLTEQEETDIDDINGFYSTDPQFVNTWIMEHYDPEIQNPNFNDAYQ